jgi:hypothetical protein
LQQDGVADDEVLDALEEAALAVGQARRSGRGHEQVGGLRIFWSVEQHSRSDSAPARMLGILIEDRAPQALLVDRWRQIT